MQWSDIKMFLKRYVSENACLQYIAVLVQEELWRCGRPENFKDDPAALVLTYPL